MITRNHGVSIGQTLNTARIVDERLTQIVIVDTPDDLAVAVDFDDPVAVRATDQRVSIFKPNRGKRPVPLLTATVIRRENFQDLPRVGIVFFDGEIKQVRDEIVSVG